MSRFFSTLIFIALVTITMPLFAQAADFEVSGWIPYWKSFEGTKDAKKHLSELTEVSPFAYSVTSKGDLKDLAGLKKSVWKKFIKDAEKEDVRIIPTIMWSDTNNIHRILSDRDLREDHIDKIVSMVKKGKYSGVDIDYEAKLAATRPYFSTFLEELDEELGNKMLVCTIEARTPPESLYRTIPANLEYANDYNEINTYCDRVRIMAYDQQRADLKLNDARSGSPYMPIADPAWVEKVIQLTRKDIDEEKLVLAVPTYGFEYTLMVSPNWYQNYARQWSVTDEYAKDLADDLNIEPMRNAAGERSFSYSATTTPNVIPRSTRAPSGTPEGNEAAARALAYANATGTTTQVNLVWWTDADAIADKVDLAKKYGLRGIAIFRIDGTEDQDLWDLF
ncbi:MAG: glycosyl hydrolase family 18 protein [Patescibacteria group bacterium]